MILFFIILTFNGEPNDTLKVKNFGNHQYMWRYTMWKTHSGKKDDWLRFQNKRLVPILVTKKD